MRKSRKPFVIVSSISIISPLALDEKKSLKEIPQRCKKRLEEDNEFKTEHCRRIDYASYTFGRGVSRPGGKTDRGGI